MQLENVDRFRTDNLLRLSSTQANVERAGESSGETGSMFSGSVAAPIGRAGSGEAGRSMLSESNDFRGAGFATVHVGRGGRIAGATVVEGRS